MRGRPADVEETWCDPSLCLSRTLGVHRQALVRPSFVPPEPIRQLRDLTRYRTEVIRERTREAQRLEKLLEDAGIKLSAVVSDILGVSGRAMLAALITGNRDPHLLADLAKGSMRRKTDALIEALTGYFTDHHAFLARAMLDRIDACTAMEKRLNERIDEQIAPFRRRIDLLVTIPGVSTRVAEVVLAEIGADITRFPTAADLASWAGVCPGNNESGGRKGPARTRHGDPWLKAALGQAAVSASRTKDTYLAARYRRITARRGKQRALVGRPPALDPHLRLAHVHPRRRIRRPRRPLLHRTHRPGPADTAPGQPAQPTRLPRDPSNRQSRLTAATDTWTVDFRISFRLIQHRS